MSDVKFTLGRIRLTIAAQLNQSVIDLADQRVLNSDELGAILDRLSYIMDRRVTYPRKGKAVTVGSLASYVYLRQNAFKRINPSDVE